MYVLDFYNRIIGHYEVPLPHPGRDRTSGRIWRVSYKGDDPKTKPAKMLVFGEKEEAELFDTGKPFEQGPLPSRLRKMQAVLDHTDSLEFPNGHTLRGVLNVGDPFFQDTEDATAKMLWLWLFEDLGVDENDYIADCLRNKSPIVRTHVMKILAERNKEWGWKETSRILAITGLQDSSPFVVRAAADVLGQHPDAANIKPLIAAHSRAAEDDVLLRYGLLRSLSYHIAAITDIADYRSLKLDDNAEKLVASTCLAVPTSISAAILLRYLENHDDNQTAYLQHAARYADVASLPDIVRIGKSKAAADLELQAQIIQSLASGLVQRDGADTRPLAGWAEEVATKLLAKSGSNRIPWTAVPIDGLPPSENPWVITPRASRDGDKDSLFFSSLPRGEQRTGIYRSGTFELPEKLSFWCAGHSGKPPAPLNDGNYIRLRDAKTHEILAESRPPRNDTARQIAWDLKAATGGRGPKNTATTGRGYVEVVDGDTANAYAWLAVGRFSLDALNPSDAPKKQQLAAEIIGKLKLAALKPQLTSLVVDAGTESSARTEIAKALASFAPEARVTALANVIADPIVPDELRTKIGQAIASRDDASLNESLREVLKRAPLRLQGTIAETLTGDAAGAATLLATIEAGQAAPRLLLLPNVSNKLTALKNGELDSRAAAITSRLPPANAILDALITDRRRAFAQAKTSADRGRAVFEKHCAACHQIAGKGALIGPQLDGIGNRGVDRLLEDVLDPNRNVDVAFRTTTLRLADGRVLSGLIRRDEGQQLVLADAQGKEFNVAKTEIDEQQKTPLSLMPANVGEIVPASEFADLVGYLLNQRAAPAGN
jgi:putative heme-binding domain-containing protein